MKRLLFLVMMMAAIPQAFAKEVATDCRELAKPQSGDPVTICMHYAETSDEKIRISKVSLLDDQDRVLDSIKLKSHFKRLGRGGLFTVSYLGDGKDFSVKVVTWGDTYITEIAVKSLKDEHVLFPEEDKQPSKPKPNRCSFGRSCH